MTDLGRRLRQLRLRKKLSIYDVERKLGIHFSTVSKYERNVRRPSLEILRELAALYEVPLAGLITDIDDLKDVLTEDQRRWLKLLEQRPELARLLDAAARWPSSHVELLARFLELGTPSGAEGEDRAQDKEPKAPAK